MAQIILEIIAQLILELTDMEEHEVRDHNELHWGFDEEGLTAWLLENEPRLQETFRAGTGMG